METIRTELQNMRNSLSNMLDSREFELTESGDRILMQAMLTIADSLDTIADRVGE